MVRQKKRTIKGYGSAASLERKQNNFSCDASLTWQWHALHLHCWPPARVIYIVLKLVKWCHNQAGLIWECVPYLCSSYLTDCFQAGAHPPPFPKKKRLAWLDRQSLGVKYVILKLCSFDSSLHCNDYSYMSLNIFHLVFSILFEICPFPPS